jgi:hypothetical protein
LGSARSGDRSGSAFQELAHSLLGQPTLFGLPAITTAWYTQRASRAPAPVWPGAWKIRCTAFR